MPIVLGQQVVTKEELRWDLSAKTLLLDF
jgi:hypothetical protein